jgi:DNA (cytosine-5)-methyltransferase 1
MTEKFKVVELFAGVGGFRLGLEGYKKKSASSGYADDWESPFEVVWSNQYEPSTPSVQHASNIYVERFGAENHINEDITDYPLDKIPAHDLLVGGFPCQDYSVAKGFKATGLEGTKGALWWEIHRILEKHANPPKYLLLENVDRLRNNPHSDRGRDFAIVLASLADLGFLVEWRVIDAAEYGMPQRRKRIYLVAYHRDTELGKEYLRHKSAFDWINRSGILAQSFPNNLGTLWNIELHGTREEIARDFRGIGLAINPETTASPGLLQLGKAKSPFQNAGFMVDRTFFTGSATAHWTGSPKHLGDIVEKNGCVPAEYFLSPEALPKWERLKGKKNLIRIHKASGKSYPYAEGAVTFPDPLNRPARTVVTGEGGAGASRFKHVIIHPATEEYRRLMPIELERLNMFPDDFTAGLPDTRRAFLMGNSVVVGVIERIGREFANRISED